MNTIHNKVKEIHIVNKIYRMAHEMQYTNVMSELKHKHNKNNKIYKHSYEPYTDKNNCTRWLELLLHITPDGEYTYRQGWVYTYDQKYKLDDTWLMIIDEEDDLQIARWRINKDTCYHFKWHNEY